MCARCSSIHHLLEYFQRIVIIDDNRFMADIIQNSRESLSLYLSIFLSLLNVSSRSSPIMILENRIRLIEIQLRCQTLFNSPRNKSGRERMNSGASLFAAWRRLLRNYATVINPVTISDVNRPLPVICNNELQTIYITNHLRYWILWAIRNTSWGECLMNETRKGMRNSYPFEWLTFDQRRIYCRSTYDKECNLNIDIYAHCTRRIPQSYVLFLFIPGNIHHKAVSHRIRLMLVTCNGKINASNRNFIRLCNITGVSFRS